jgi:tail protein P2 I
MSVAEWLPGALREAPPDEPRLLEALLAAVDGQVAQLEQAIDALYDDAFIESCADAAVPYIGALLGLPADAERLEVASAIALRRRKGTPAALQDFAAVVTGLTARVLEGWQLTTWTQRLGHPPPPRPAALDLRAGERFRAGTPFDPARHSFTPSGRYAPRAATAVVWPWQTRTYRSAECCPLPEPARFALHPLGPQAPPYLRPPAGEQRRDELGAPVRATYRVLQALGPGQIAYGVNWSVAADHPLAAELEPGYPALLGLEAGGAAIPWTALRFGSLPPGGPAAAAPGPGEAVVDLARAHVELGAGLAAPLRATWHRPTPGQLGALAAAADADPAARVVVVVNPALPATGLVVHTLADAFALAEAQSAGLAEGAVEIRLETSDRLVAPPPQAFAPTLSRWRVVAPRAATPTVAGDLALDLTDADVTLEGFGLTGDLALGARLTAARLASLTMSPPTGAVLSVAPGAWGLRLEAHRCVLGALRADLGAFPVVLEDCVVDGRGERLSVCGPPPAAAPRDAVGAATTLAPVLQAARVTFAGAVRAESADATDCLFADGIEVVQQQEGCLRHCYLGPEPSPSLPVIYRCGPFPAPTFASVGFEAAGYYALDPGSGHPLLTAASDGGEVGAHHDLRRAARIARLDRRIHEFVPLGVRPGLALAPWEE